MSEQTIGQRIKHRLIDLEKNQTWLAEQLGYGRDRRAVINNWVNDVNRVDIHVLPTLCRALGCSIDWLLTGEAGNEPRS